MTWAGDLSLQVLEAFVDAGAEHELRRHAVLERARSREIERRRVLRAEETAFLKRRRERLAPPPVTPLPEDVVGVCRCGHELTLRAGCRRVTFHHCPLSERSLAGLPDVLSGRAA